MSTALALTSSKLHMRTLQRVRLAAPLWWNLVLITFGLFALTQIAGLMDGRLINGVSVWEKPSKFFLSFAAHFITFAWAFHLMPAGERQKRTNRWLSYVFVVVAALELIYIAFRAARGEASHFNTESELAQILYSLMGLGALSLTAITAYFGWRVLTSRDDLAARAMGVGLMLGAILGTLAGGYLGAQSSHWIGGIPSDAAGLPFFHWSTTGGDLRVAHFFGLHAMQLVPLAAWLWPRPWTVLAASAVISLLTAATFLQAVAGYPLIAL
jgi:hypothetical protein